VTPYEVWFGRPPPKDFQEQKDSIRRAQITSGELGVEDGDREEGRSEVKEAEEDLFVNEHLEEEEQQEEMVLTKLIKRVKEHMVKQQANMVKKAGARALIFNPQEVATLQIAKQYRFSTEPSRIPVRILEKTAQVRKVCLGITSKTNFD
jgi:hypothetical protein